MIRSCLLLTVDCGFHITQRYNPVMRDMSISTKAKKIQYFLCVDPIGDLHLYF